MLRWTGHPPSQATAADGADLQSAAQQPSLWGRQEYRYLGLGLYALLGKSEAMYFFWCRREGRVGDGVEGKAGEEVALMF